MTPLCFLASSGLQIFCSSPLDISASEGEAAQSKIANWAQGLVKA